jgi:hypothetical protein
MVHGAGTARKIAVIQPVRYNASVEQARTVSELQRLMEAAAEAMDFERARALRDRINLMRGGAASEDAALADTAGLLRQQPGSMGLGTSQQRVTPPAGWTPPPRPDLLTRGSSRGRGRKS